MKKKFYLVLALTAILGVTSLKAQTPYKHSVGLSTGTIWGFSYKGFFGEHFAIQGDLGYNMWFGYGSGWSGSFVLNPLAMYEANIVQGLHWFAGGGFMIGGAGWGGKFGLHGLGGLEYKFNIPLTVQFDLRPGVGIAFDSNDSWVGFDMGICASVRYTF